MNTSIWHVKQALCQSLKHLDIEDISDNDRLREDLGLDSMSSLSFLIALEDAIEGFHVKPESLMPEDLKSVKTVAAYVERTQ